MKKVPTGRGARARSRGHPTLLPHSARHDLCGVK